MPTPISSNMPMVTSMLEMDPLSTPQLSAETGENCSPCVATETMALMRISRWVLALFFIAAGTMHFVAPGAYLKIVPPALPWPGALVAISGLAEILGGVGVLLPPLRRAAVYGLIALLWAVFPANIYMAVAHLPLPGVFGQSWVQWARLPLQFVLMWWVWRVR